MFPTMKRFRHNADLFRIKLAGADALSEGRPFVMSVEQGLFVRILAVPKCDTLWLDGDLNACLRVIF